MPLQKLPVVDLDNVNHRRRARETINQVLDHSFDDSRRQLDAEKLAGVTPINAAFPPGDIRRYGGNGDGTTNNDGPLAQLLLVMKQGIDGYIPNGTFAFTTSPNYAYNGLTLRGERNAILKHTGSGIAFNIDANAAAGGGTGNRVDGLEISGFVVQGNANTTNIFHIVGAVRSRFSYLEARTGCTGKAFYLGWGVPNRYDTCFISFNVAAITTDPLYGFFVTDDGAAGNYTANCTFINCLAEGFNGNGCTLRNASGNVFIGGTFEACDIGVDIDSDVCRRNHFINLWCEGNATNDLRIKGVNNSFKGGYFVSASSGNTVDISTGSATTFFGGFVRVVNLQGTSRDTLFVGTTFSDNSSLGITGTGTYKAIGCTEADTNLDITTTLTDVVGETANFTPTILGSATAGTTTYTTQQGYYHRVGDIISFQLRVGWSAQTGTGNLLVAGLPFTSKNTNSQPVSLLADALTYAGQISAAVKPNSTQIEIFSLATGASVANVPLDTAASLWITGVYFA